VVLFKGEFSNKLSAKYKFNIPENFNFQLNKIKSEEETDFQ
jgi:hypothetical protein